MKKGSLGLIDIWKHKNKLGHEPSYVTKLGLMTEESCYALKIGFGT